jgi:hypothetical protein
MRNRDPVRGRFAPAVACPVSGGHEPFAMPFSPGGPEVGTEAASPPGGIFDDVGVF